MLKRISIQHLTLGMYLHEFCGSWMDHPFWRAKFVLKDPKDLARIQSTAIDEVWIDTSKGLDVAAGVRQQLEADAARVGGVRLLPGRFMVIEQAMGLPAGRGDAAQALLRSFVEQAKASGFVAAALQRHGIAGAMVAPAQQPT